MAASVNTNNKLFLAAKQCKDFSEDIIILGILYELTYLVTLAVVSSPLARHFSAGAPDCISVVLWSPDTPD